MAIGGHAQADRFGARGSIINNDIIDIYAVGGSAAAGGINHDGDTSVGTRQGVGELLIGGGEASLFRDGHKGGRIARIGHGANLEGAASVVTSSLQRDLLAGQVGHHGQDGVLWLRVVSSGNTTIISVRI